MKAISFTNRAKRDLKKLDTRSKSAIIEKLSKFSKNQVQALPLTGGWKGGIRFAQEIFALSSQKIKKVYGL